MKEAKNTHFVVSPVSGCASAAASVASALVGFGGGGMRGMFLRLRFVLLILLLFLLPLVSRRPARTRSAPTSLLATLTHVMILLTVSAAAATTNNNPFISIALIYTILGTTTIRTNEISYNGQKPDTSYTDN